MHVHFEKSPGDELSVVETHTTRLALTIGDVPFEDERIDYTTWAKRKALMPYKKIPVLTVDGQMLCQSHAIARYVAKLARLYPTDNHLAACHVDEVTDSVDEFILLLATVFLEQDPAKRVAIADELANDTLPDKFAMLEARLAETAATNRPWYLDAISFADLEIYHLVHTFKSGFLPEMPKDYCDQYTRTMAIYKAVASHPKVAAWNAAHKTT
ncbi:unnamed protein product [Aphanomyces euteiches]